MIEGLKAHQLRYFCDMLIMANDYQLQAMGYEIIQELTKRRERQLSELPRFNNIK